MKYSCWFCGCGRIHILANDLYDWMTEDYEHRSIVQVCNNCGTSHKIFLSDNGEGFDVNAMDLRDVNIDILRPQECKILFNKGIKVPMKSGGYATYHFHDGYVNVDYIRDKLGTTYIPTALEKDPECTTVDTELLIREVNDEDILQSISGYLVGIDWTGTKYERK